MARQCNFDKEEKLAAAMALFWRQGYANTSVADLVAHLGINRFSLYNTYGDKHNLYRQALAHYLERESLPPLAELERPDAGLAELEGFLRRFVAQQRRQPQGCLVQNALLEHGRADADVARCYEQLFARVEQAFRRVLEQAAAAGELAPGVDPGRLARFLLVQLQGIRVLGRAGLHPALADALAVLLHYLDGLRRAP
ncbi:TetR/AcrR family transcriptional regulator [Zobellella endophytica]|uniref:TetR/AcrR family transcriptional regulator n=1 Tax=Zobellella endophytica TaxID=2116700 RepID=A0A2P7QQU1_9GAMM|nr:TetR/AcrR family transcriptional regulator [Zobellella endophytica]PSJ40336.1 TetR/AcrR family transcriptional regulator [Zobellella endophytica]